MAKVLRNLFNDTLKDIYFAEKKILIALPKMQQRPGRDLKAAFTKHENGTRAHIERLELVFAENGEEPQERICAAIVGILDEGNAAMAQYEGSPALDAALIGSAQAVEHYEMSRYSSLTRWSRGLGRENSRELLQQTLDEEVAIHESFEDLADASVYDHADA